MKIVVNKCYGGFGLSKEAVLELYKRGSPVVKARDPEEYFHTKDWEKELHKCSYLNLVLYEGKILDAQEHEDSLRSDPELVKVVEEMGEKAFGQYSKLAVTEIPDGVRWTIEEYDGKEWVAEAHQTW